MGTKSFRENYLKLAIRPTLPSAIADGLGRWRRGQADVLARCRWSQVTTDAGLLAYRELDETLGLTEMSADRLQDSRLGQNKQHGLLPLLRQSIYSRLAGYEDVNDAERLSIDSAMRHVVGGRASQPEKQVASSSELGRFETEALSTPSNLKALLNLSGRWVDAVHQRKPLKELILGLNSSVSETYGRQQGTAYNGYIECPCYHAPEMLQMPARPRRPARTHVERATFASSTCGGTPVF